MLAMVGAVRPSRDRGGSLELEMMAAGELVGAEEEVAIGKRKRVATTSTRVHRSFGEP